MPVIRIEMLSGRTDAQKHELAAVLSKETARIAKCAPMDVQLIITEVDRKHWAIGGVLIPNPADAETIVVADRHSQPK